MLYFTYQDYMNKINFFVVYDTRKTYGFLISFIANNYKIVLSIVTYLLKKIICMI